MEFQHFSQQNLEFFVLLYHLSQRFLDLGFRVEFFCVLVLDFDVVGGELILGQLENAALALRAVDLVEVLLREEVLHFVQVVAQLVFQDQNNWKREVLLPSKLHIYFVVNLR